MKFMTRLTLLSLLFMLTVSLSFAQEKKPDAPATPGAPAAPKETPKPGPKPFREVITDKAISSKGLVNVHKVEDKWFFEIPDSIFKREIMTVTRYSKTAAGGGIFGGEEVNRQVIAWERGPDNKVFLRSITQIIVSPDSTKPIFKAVKIPVQIRS